MRDQCLTDLQVIQTESNPVNNSNSNPPNTSNNPNRPNNNQTEQPANNTNTNPANTSNNPNRPSNNQNQEPVNNTNTNPANTSNNPNHPNNNQNQHPVNNTTTNPANTNNPNHPGNNQNPQPVNNTNTNNNPVPGIKTTDRQMDSLSRIKIIMQITMPIETVSIVSNKIQSKGLTKTISRQRISITNCKNEFLFFKQPANAAGCCVLYKSPFSKTAQSAFCYLANVAKYFYNFFLHKMCSF